MTLRGQHTRALLGLLVLTGIAHAETKPIVTPPAGWREDPEQARALSAAANEMSHFGGARALATVRVHVPPETADFKNRQGRRLIVLVTTAVAAEVTKDREVAARVAVDDLHATSRRAALSGSGIAEDGWEEKVDAQRKQIDAWLVWHDETAQTKSTSHLVIAATANGMVAVLGECIEAQDVATVEAHVPPTPAQLVAACRTALDTLDPGLEPAQRVALGLAPAGTEPPREPSPRTLPATINDGSRAPLPPMPVSHDQRTTDRRPVYVGLGLVVLAALFWWNRRRRAHLEEKSDER